LRKASCGSIEFIFLMGQGFIPFPTAVMGEYPMNPLAVSLFGAVMAVNTLLFIALQSYILRNLIKPEMVSEKIPHLTRKSFVGVISYLLGVAATWLNVHIAFILYALTPLFFITRRRAIINGRRSSAEPWNLFRRLDRVIRSLPFAHLSGFPSMSPPPGSLHSRPTNFFDL
jgi:hypothetical protein